MVIFAGGKFRKNVGKKFHLGGNFYDTTPISFIKAYGYYLRVGIIFAKKTKAHKTRKLTLRENFYDYSTFFSVAHFHDFVACNRCLSISQ